MREKTLLDEVAKLHEVNNGLLRKSADLRKKETRLLQEQVAVWESAFYRLHEEASKGRSRDA